MKQIQKISLLLSIFISTVIFSCSDSNDPDPSPAPPVVKITTDKSIIKADGIDQVSFTVTADGNEIKTPVSILLKEDSVTLDKMSFTTEKAGFYTFYAIYEGEKSNEINIEATEAGVMLTVDKTIIKANNKDIATFSITIDGKDITSAATITLLGTTDSILEGTTFATQQANTYKFYATYDNKKSNEISIEASTIALILSVDKKTLNIDMAEKATFNVVADGNDITNESEIILVEEPELPLTTNIFEANHVRDYTFYAKYDGFTSNQITINVVYKKMDFLQRFAFFQATSTACRNCVIMRNLIAQVSSQDPKRYETIGLHLRGKYCTSGLSGDPTLYGVAERFADMGDPIYTPPLTVVELHHPVQLWNPNSFTIEDLNKCVAFSKSARGGSSNSGIAIESSINGTNIEFTVDVRSNTTNQYRFFAYVVEDKIIHPQITGKDEWDEKYEHNNVATYMLENVDPFQGIEFGEVARGQEQHKTFTIDMSHFNPKRTVNINNCRIVAYTLRMMNDKYRIDNIVSCPVNGSVNFQYETE